MSVTVPPIITQPFAETAGPTFLQNPLPILPTGTPRASFDEGFPPIVFMPKIAGGKPIDGRDLNGILYAVTAHCAYINAGQPYKYDAAVVTALTGYGTGAVVGMADGSGLWLSITNNNAADPDGANTNWASLFSYGPANVNLGGTASGTIALTVAQGKRKLIVLTGTLVGNVNITLPLRYQEWLIVNSTTGAFTLTVRHASGTGVDVPSGGFANPVGVYSDGTNVQRVMAPLSLPIDVNPTSNTIAKRDANGYLFAQYFNQASGLESALSINAIFCQYATNDGFFRKIPIANFAAQIVLSQFAGQVSNGQVPQSAVTQHSAAILANAALTGTPTADTAPPGTNNTQVANTAFVQANKVKFASISMTGGGSILSAVNCTGSRTATGTYVIDVSAAGFVQLPNPVACIDIKGINIDQCYAQAVSTTTIVVRTNAGVAGLPSTDRNFNLIVTGA